eukprot:gb/GFBE01038769.1/.p1 GENE.gb/GFBE01038769.1/~~gb/GFBE01038769.1/.p1  ORF type:complete len:107 (+),score=23.57 gb/GFBE01038769.1/:1-321(+)
MSFKLRVVAFVLAILAVPLTSHLWQRAMMSIYKTKHNLEELIAKDGMGVFFQRCCIAVILMAVMWLASQYQEADIPPAVAGPKPPPRQAPGQKKDGQQEVPRPKAD